MKRLNDNKATIQVSRSLVCSTCGYSEEANNKIGYNEAFADAQERLAKGERQLQCSECFHWYWEIKHELHPKGCLCCR